MVLTILTIALCAPGAHAQFLHDLGECSKYCGDVDEHWCSAKGDASDCWEAAYREVHDVAECLERYRECVTEAREKACALLREALEKRALAACEGVWICEYDTRQRFIKAPKGCGDDD